MLRLLLVCSVLAAGGGYVLVYHRDFALVGIALVVLPAIVIMQGILLFVSSCFFPTTPEMDGEAEPKVHVSDFAAILYAYRSFKLFAARMTGFVAIAYGAVTQSAYYIILGFVAVGLFWLWDRIIAADLATPVELPGNSDSDTR